MEVEKGKIHAPEMGEVWLNSTPLTMSGLRGRVVLVDFWDYTCVNCLRTLPYVVEWHRRYAAKGLTVIGVHTPEFSFARTREFVEAAVRRLGIEYPVVLDNHYAIWQAYANRCWPAKYLVDKDGYLRSFHFGEGDYEATELAIQELLREAHPALELPAPLGPMRATDRPGAACYRTTPELYLGHRRGRLGNTGGFQHTDEEKPGEYKLPEGVESDVCYLSGPWLSGAESVRSAAGPGTPASVLLYYTAKDVNLVMVPNGGPHTVEILQNGQPIAPADAGEDVHADGYGRCVVTVDEPRMYRLVSNGEFGQRLLQLVTREPGVECFAFTFGSCIAEEA